MENIWVGYEDGGWGNGPCRKHWHHGGKPKDRVVEPANGRCMAVEVRWYAAEPKDVYGWHDINAIARVSGQPRQPIADWAGIE